MEEKKSIYLLKNIYLKENKKVIGLLGLKSFLNTLKDEDLDNWEIKISPEKKSTSKKKGNGEGTLYYSETLKKWIGQFWNGDKRETLTQRKNETVKAFKERYYKAREQMKDGTYIEKSKETVISLIDSFIKQKYIDGTTLDRSYKRNLDTLSQIKKTCDNFCNLPIQNVTIKHIEKAKEKIKKYSNSEIDKIWGLLKKAFSIASSPSRRILIYNLMQDENLKKPLSEIPTKKIKPLKQDEVEKLINILDNEERYHRHRNVIKMQLISGMRIGEVLSRSINDYDKENKFLNIHNTVSRDKDDKPILSPHTKTYNKETQIDEGQRILPINIDNGIFNELSEIILEQENKGINNPYKLLFWDYKKNKLLNPSTINSWIKRLNAKYKICEGELTTHRLRHTAITHWAELGLDIRAIQYFAGHIEGSDITEQVYIDTSLDFSIKALKNLTA